MNCFVGNFIAGNFLVSKEPPHRPILLDFGLTKKLSSSIKQALAKMFLASAEVCTDLDFLSLYESMLSDMKKYHCVFLFGGNKVLSFLFLSLFVLV
jgi:hypothetical protein